MSRFPVQETFVDKTGIEEAVEWLMLDRASYEERLAERWDKGSVIALDPKQSNEAAADLILMVATREGRHCVRAWEGNARIKTVFVEYRSVASLQPGEYRWLDPNHLVMRSACKGEMVRLCLQALSDYDATYDYAAFIDDDVTLSAADLLEAADLALQNEITAFQLRLKDPNQSVWGNLLSAPAERCWKQVGFVEMMAPVLHQSTLKIAAIALTNSYSGFGCDYYLTPILQLLQRELRIAVWGGASMIHERPVQTSGIKVFPSGRTATQEEERLRAALLSVLLKQLFGPVRLTPLSMDKIARDLLRALKNTSKLGAFERAFVATTHRHWSGQHDLAEVKTLRTENQQLSGELRTATSSLRDTLNSLKAIETSKAWRTIELYRRCLKVLRGRS